ncbi:MAG: spore maturation protein [Alicyclobacillus sp.]|nr:spore maturation protein [Alicyclobacillus sp.]
MIDLIWLSLFLVGVATAAWTGRMHDVAQAILTGAESGVTLAIALISVVAFWLGLMNVAEQAGLVQALTRALRPVGRFLFPSVPPDHPAMGAILANMSANLLGIGNAATPLGLKAMQELQRLNPQKDTASDAMCTLLALNTASITLIPTTVIAVRMQSGSQHPTSIIGTTLLATAIGTAAAIVLDRLFRRWYQRREQ